MHSFKTDVTVGQVAVGLLPLLASVVFACSVRLVDFDVGMSFVVLGLSLSIHLFFGIRGRSPSAANASVFVFALMFLFVAPIIQISVLGFKLVNTTHAVPDLIIMTNLACSVFTAAYLLVRVILRKVETVQVSATTDKGFSSLFNLSIMVMFCGFITLVSIPFLGSGLTLNPVTLAFRKFVFFIPTAAFFLLLVDYLMPGRQRSFLHASLLLVLFLFVLVTQNPSVEKRNALGPVYLSALFIIFRPYLQRKSVQVLLLGAIVLVLFPFSALFTHARLRDLTSENFALNIISDHFLEVHYDSWANIYSSIEIAARNGLSHGRQLLGALLFYVPSAWWPDKPLATGIAIGNFLEVFYTMWFTNLSAPLVAEGYLDFGFFGVAAYGGILAFFVNRIERWSERDMSVMMQALGIYLAFFLVFLLRGSMMVAFAYGSAAISAFIVSYLMLLLLTALSPARWNSTPSAKRLQPSINTVTR